MKNNWSNDLFETNVYKTAANYCWQDYNGLM